MDKEFRVANDASDFAVAEVLLQQVNNQEWHPVAFASRKLTSAERYYTAAERETLAGWGMVLLFTPSSSHFTHTRIPSLIILTLLPRFSHHCSLHTAFPTQKSSLFPQFQV